MSSSERTPLTSQRPPGPAYVFPGVSSRSRRRQIRQFQCCMCFLFSSVSLIILIAVLLAIIYTATEQIPPPNDNETELLVPLPFIPLNDSETKSILLLSVQDPLDDETVEKWGLPNPLLSLMVDSERYGRKSLGDRELFEENVSQVPLNSPSFRHQRAMGTSAEARKYARRGLVEQEATRYLADKLNYTKPKKRSNIGEGPEITLQDKKSDVDCNKFTRYRAANGTCNNLKHKSTWGTIMQPFRRILQPDYADGISAPRASHSNVSLPSARQVSLQVHRPSYSTDPNFTVMLAVWGQFLDHDITATALAQISDGSPIDCCVEKEHLHPECFPVPLGPGDPLYDNKNLTCMSFLRSAAASTGKIGPRQQFTQVTSFIDGSVVYGSTDELQNSLRSGEKGMLRMLVTKDNRMLLPVSTDPKDGCNEAEMNAEGKYCFDAGDSRANENLHLTSMHLLLARHHNYLAENLGQQNPNWTDEKIFQEARKILGAQMQHITYNEFLPVLFGADFAQAKGLSPKSRSGDTYRENVNPTVANGFVASAFRFAHTLLPGLMRASRNDTSKDYVNLHKMLFNPYSLYDDDGVDDALRSAMHTPMEKSDQYFTPELTEKLFEKSSDDEDFKGCTNCHVGLDLVSLNIQRGRDHGLPPYYEWRKHCKLPDTDTWEKMSYAVSELSLQNIKAVYDDPKDIDFYCGALSEPPMQGSVVGPLLACIISDQFWRIKYGDSHWYERTEGPQRFTKPQLDEIYKTSLAKLMCINSDHIEEVQRFVMRKSNPDTNPIVKCSEIDDFDFSLWKSTKTAVKMSSESIKPSIRTIPNNGTLTNTTRKVLD